MRMIGLLIFLFACATFFVCLAVKSSPVQDDIRGGITLYPAYRPATQPTTRAVELTENP